MEVGFILDNAHVSLVPSLWVKGPPERSFWRFTKIAAKKKRSIAACRCLQYGFLESYATDEWKGWPQK
jgi:hypothetical protein